LITIKLPALRERSKDIPLLVAFFIENLKKIYGRPELNVSKDAMKWLQGLVLPGNIRQLKNLVERAVLISRKDVLEVEDLRPQLEASPQKKGGNLLPEVGTVTLDEVELQMIQRAMAFHKNKISKAAGALGITRSSLYRRLQKYNIPYDEASD
jgi:DNA-binding NtrC family response regulator